MLSKYKIGLDKQKIINKINFFLKNVKLTEFSNVKK